MAIDSEAAMAVALFVSTASVAWSAAYAWGKWLHRPQPGGGPPDVVEIRLARLEQAVEAVAEEVERLGEGQRFTARLLETRLPSAPGPVLPSQAHRADPITPH